jgi:NodT family efflux transporter outer membrane factor (OMF) lipoprotein
MLPTPLQLVLHTTLLSSLCGCASWSRPPQRPPDPIPPAAWQGHAVATLTAPAIAAPGNFLEVPWWQELKDPQLNALQTLALQTNVDTLRKALSWQSALTQAQLTALNEQPRPSLGLSTNTSHALHSGATSVVVNGVNVPVNNAQGTSRNYGGNVGFSYEWDLWSKLAQASRGDLAYAESRREDWLAARWLASIKVAETYWTIAAIEAKLPMLTELTHAAGEALRIAKTRLAEGKLRADEVDAAITKQYEARKRVADAQADRRLKMHALALLLGQEPPMLVPGEVRLPSSEPSDPVLGTPAQTLERRPDVRQARLAVDSALAQLHVAEASRYPSLHLNLGLNTNGNNWRDWFSQPLAMLGLNLAVPLVDWRRLDAQRDMARNTLDDAALALRASVHQALVDVEGALVEGERWQQEWEAAQMQRSEKEKVYAVARLRQQVGVYGSLNVMQSKQEVLTAQIVIIDLRLKAWVNRLNLYKALGGPV